MLGFFSQGLSCSITVERHHGHDNFYKIFNWGLAFRGLVHCHHGKEYGGTEGSRELPVWIQRQQEDRDSGPGLLKPHRPPLVTQFLKQGRTYSKEATPNPYQVVPHPDA